jgi:hypothetical protein
VWFATIRLIDVYICTFVPATCRVVMHFRLENKKKMETKPRRYYIRQRQRINRNKRSVVRGEMCMASESGAHQRAHTSLACHIIIMFAAADSAVLPPAMMRD